MCYKLRKRVPFITVKWPISVKIWAFRAQKIQSNFHFFLLQNCIFVLHQPQRHASWQMSRTTGTVRGNEANERIGFAEIPEKGGISRYTHDLLLLILIFKWNHLRGHVYNRFVANAWHSHCLSSFCDGLQFARGCEYMHTFAVMLQCQLKFYFGCRCRIYMEIPSVGEFMGKCVINLSRHGNHGKSNDCYCFLCDTWAL